MYVFSLILQNMVGPGEVDEDLQPETTEECSKYGEVANCLVYEVRLTMLVENQSSPYNE